MSRPIRWAGTRALLVELPSLEEVVALHGALAENPLPGQVEVLAAAETVLIRFASRAAALSGRTAVGRLEAVGARAQAGRTVEIDVVYTGEDLAEVGRLTGLGPEGVVAAHTGRLWTAAFGGFAPGSATLPAEIQPWRFRAGTPPAWWCRPAPWPWPGGFPRSIRAVPPGAGS